MSDLYILNPDKTVRKAATEDDKTKAYMILGSEDKIVAKDNVGDALVSTVFLGIDHDYGRCVPPVLFETLVFGGERDQEMHRYSTWQEAEEGHARIVWELILGAI